MDTIVDDVWFQHTPLPDPNTHFRLIRILQGGFDQPVACELSVWPIDQSPAYIAISYAWGDPDSLANITINSKSTIVRKNCEYVLQQQASISAQSDNHFWIDAICIDQQSIHEKNHQVALIGKLYKNAAQVHACIGPHADDSHYLMNATGWVQYLLSCIQQQRADKSGVTIPHFTSPLQLLCYATVKAQMRRRLLEAFLAILKRPYFTRVWVLQELFLGTRVSICCGSTRQPVAYILAIIDLVRFWTMSQPGSNRGGKILAVPKAVFQAVSQTWAQTKRFPRRLHASIAMKAALIANNVRCDCLKLADSASAPQSLSDFLWRMNSFNCADPRDKIYGALSLINWGNNPVPIPDYNKDSFQLATEIMAIFLLHNQLVTKHKFFRPSEKSMMDVASYLLALLQVSTDEVSIQTAIKARKVAIPSMAAHGEELDLLRRLQQLSRPDQSGEERSTLAFRQRQMPSSGFVDEEWQGVVLRPKGHVSALPLRFRPFSRAASQGEHPDMALLEFNDLAVGYVPANTKDGDWLVWHTSCQQSFKGTATIEGSRRAIIIEYLPNGLYNLKGHVFLLTEWTKVTYTTVNYYVPFLAPHLQQFDIYWHVQDLLVAAWHNAQQRPHNHSLDDIAKWLNIRICVEEGSSFAVGPHKVVTSPILYLARKEKQ